MSFLLYKGALYIASPVPVVPKYRLFDVDGFTVYRVDGAKIREELEPDFTNWGQPLRFPDLIPSNELWLDVENADSELEFFVHRALIEHRLMKDGYTYDEANEIGSGYEERERNDAATARGEDPPTTTKEVKLEKLGRTNDGVDVWLVDGDAVRTYYYVDFTEGGHDLVYDFIPAREIWLDDDLKEAERPYVLLHERIERDIMEKKKWPYDKAHNEALRVEQAFRASEDQYEN